MWTLESYEVVYEHTFAHSSKISSLAIVGKYLLTGSADHTVKVTDMTTTTEVATLTGHKNWVFAMTATGDNLYTASDNIMVWPWAKLSKAAPSCAVERPHDAPVVQCMAISDDNRYLVTSSLDGVIKVWELDLKSKSKPVLTLEAKSKFIFGLAVTESRIFTADRSGSINVFEAP